MGRTTWCMDCLHVLHSFLNHQSVLDLLDCSRPARALLIRLLHKTKFNLPSSPPSNLFQWALILRLTPGVPFIFSNYGLGVLQMPFISYLLISVPIIGITACGYVLTFAGIFTGNWSYIWFGICLIAIMIIAGRIAVKGRQHAD